MALAPREVTVIIPTFNSERTIARALESVLFQSFSDWEVIISDDGSSDETLSICKSLVSPDRLSIIRSLVNRGPSAARNRALETSSGHWVALLDSDDAWRPNRLNTLLNSAAEKNTGIIADNLIGFDQKANIETGPLFKVLPETVGVAEIVLPVFGGGYYNLGYLKPIIRRDLIFNRNLRYDENLRTGEDLIFLINALGEERLTLLSECLYVYTTPLGESSKRPSGSSQSKPRDIELARALTKLIDDQTLSLSNADTRAINLRVDFLRQINDVSEFRHDFLHGRYYRAIRSLLTHSSVRRHVLEFIRRKVGP